MRILFTAILLLLFAASAGYCQQPTIVLDKNGRYVEHIDKETDIEMILVDGGAFNMGSNDYPEEQPIHRVYLNSYYISKYEITQQQWYAVVHYNYSYYDKCPTCPVEMVSWGDVQEFTDNLNKLTGKHYRLPTEAEWEYAARGGKRSQHYTYSGSNNSNKVAWHFDYFWTDIERTHRVGEKEPNELGLYDMSGNLMEWCSDWYDPDYYKQNVTDNPKGPAAGKLKVVRGGGLGCASLASTTTYRSYANKGYLGCDPGKHWLPGCDTGFHRGVRFDTGTHFSELGFRIVRDR